MELLPLWIILGTLGFSLIFFGLLFGVFMPKLVKMREEQQKLKAEEKIRKQQTISSDEKEKLELELAKQKMVREAEAEAKNLQPKFCQYCGAKFPPGSRNCPSCGAKLQD